MKRRDSIEDHKLTENATSPYNRNKENKWGFAPMRDYIEPQGKCRFCKLGFKWNDDENMFCCPVHFTVPKLFQVNVPFKGERIRRGTDWQGNTLHTHYEAQKLAEQAKKEIAANTFDPDKWRIKKKIEFHPGRLYVKWYKEKLKAMKRGDLKPSYTVKLRSYYRLYFRPYGIKKTLDDAREIKSTKDFFESLPQHLSPKYRKNLKLALAAFFHWMQREYRIIPEIPWMPDIRVPKHIPVVVDKDFQLELLNDYIRPWHRDIFGFMICQGCRPGEAIALYAECIKTDKNLGPYVEYTKTLSEGQIVDNPKDAEDRVAPLFTETLHYIPKRLPGALLFQTRGKAYSLTILEKELDRALRIYNKAMQQRAREIGAIFEPVKIKLYEFVKHSLSTQLYDEGYSLHDIQKFHGHSSPETSLIYTKIDVLKRFKSRGAVTEIKKPKKSNR
ncbi:MAG: tyrosine-type recombinase/integrase [Dissulfurispiraceae bacterium]